MPSPFIAVAEAAGEGAWIGVFDIDCKERGCRSQPVQIQYMYEETFVKKKKK